jgi:hypothetical protein
VQKLLRQQNLTDSLSTIKLFGCGTTRRGLRTAVLMAEHRQLGCS